MQKNLITKNITNTQNFQVGPSLSRVKSRPPLTLRVNELESTPTKKEEKKNEQLKVKLNNYSSSNHKAASGEGSSSKNTSARKQLLDQESVLQEFERLKLKTLQKIKQSQILQKSSEPKILREQILKVIGDCISENISNNHKTNNNGCADLSGYASNGIGCGSSSAGYLSNNNNSENYCSLNQYKTNDNHHFNINNYASTLSTTDASLCLSNFSSVHFHEELKIDKQLNFIEDIAEQIEINSPVNNSKVQIKHQTIINQTIDSINNDKIELLEDEDTLERCISTNLFYQMQRQLQHSSVEFQHRLSQQDDLLARFAESALQSKENGDLSNLREELNDRETTIVHKEKALQRRFALLKKKELEFQLNTDKFSRRVTQLKTEAKLVEQMRAKQKENENELNILWKNFLLECERSFSQEKGGSNQQGVQSVKKLSAMVSAQLQKNANDQELIKQEKLQVLQLRRDLEKQLEKCKLEQLRGYDCNNIEDRGQQEQQLEFD